MMDFKELANFGLFGWLKEKNSLKYFLTFFFFMFLSNLVVSYVIYFLFEPIAKNPSILPAQMIPTIIYFVLFIILFVAIVSLFSVFLIYFIIQSALKAKGKPTVDFTLVRAIRLIILGLFTTLASVFSIFKKKLLLVPIGGIVSFLVAIILFFVSSKMSSSYAGGEYLVAMIVVLIGGLFLLLSMGLFIAYLFVVYYNAMRLSMAQLIFIEKEKSLFECLKESWEVTRGKVLLIFGVLFVLVLFAMIVAAIASVPLQVYSVMIEATKTSTTIASLDSLIDPIAIILSVPSMIVQVALIFVQTFVLVGLYDLISGKKKLSLTLSSSRADSKKSIKKNLKKSGKKK